MRLLLWRILQLQNEVRVCDEAPRRKTNGFGWNVAEGCRSDPHNDATACFLTRVSRLLFQGKVLPDRWFSCPGARLSNWSVGTKVIHADLQAAAR